MATAAISSGPPVNLPTTPFTTSQDVVDLFCATPRACAQLEQWRVDHRYARDVVTFVERHETRVIYTLTPRYVQNVVDRTEHALGNVRSDHARSIPAVANWNPPFTFSYVLHHYCEKLGALPTFQGLRSFCSEDTDGSKILGEPIRILRNDMRRHGVREDRLKDAIRWRIGNAYYSFLREMWIVAHLRQIGLDVRVHPLADAVFRVDAWCGRKVLLIYISNEEYRGKDGGRKLAAEQLLADASPPFDVVEMRLTTTPAFGKCYLPEPEEILRAAADLDSDRDGG